jgi:hypothetical protein
MATFDIEALKADLPTAKELAQFVYDKTQIALDLVGKPKEEQYLVAKNALEGKKIPQEFITEQNPYVDKKETIPIDEIRKLPERSKDLPDPSSQVHFFGATNMPHPQDPQSDKKVHISFRKYDNGVITYQIVGPIEQLAVGSRLNKYGQVQPEKYSWTDPRTEELVMRRVDGSFTEKGRGLYTFCIGEKGAGIWGLIDKDIVSTSSKNIADPWA